MNKFSELSDDQLRELLTTSRQMLNSLVTSLNDRSDMQDAIARLMEPDNMLETFYELASAEA
jgi:predicted component of type VI protein secretion system